MHLVTVYYVAHKVSHSSSTYGPLGAATAILLSLFLIARVIVFGASLNAELWRALAGVATPGAPQRSRRQTPPDGAAAYRRQRSPVATSCMISSA